MSRFAWLVVCLTLGSMATGAHAQTPYRALDGRDVEFTMPSSTDSSAATEILLAGGQRYEIYETPTVPAWHRGLWMSGSTPFNGTPSFSFEGCQGPILDGSADCPSGSFSDNPNHADRVELAIDSWSSGDDMEEVKLGRRRYVSFWVNFHEDTQAPLNWTLVHQVWQRMNASRSPPFAIFVAPDSLLKSNSAKHMAPLVLNFVARNDGNFSTGQTIYSMPIERSQWHQMTFLYQPSLDAAQGLIAFWLDKPTSQVPDMVWRGAWGYTPTLPIENQFDVRVGIYRRQQPRRMKVMFNNIKLGPTAASIMD